MKQLEIRDLTIHYITRDGVVKAVNGIDLDIEKGRTLGLVGETGAGKTTTALGILRLIDPPGKIVSGSIKFEGREILDMSPTQLRDLRGGSISMIFQDPMTALNPVITVEQQLAEMIFLHTEHSNKQSHIRALEILEMVGIPADRGGDFPHQFSGGMKQRVVIAIALACSPALVIADEPTTALDVTIQAQVLDMINDLKNQLGTSMLLITHDLGIVAETCDSVAIMYAGEIVEYGSADQVFNNVAHPYTKGLFNSLPSLDRDVERLRPIRGLMPDPISLPEGCSFHPRCPYTDELCMTASPELKEVGEGHLVRCHHCGKGLPLYFPDDQINEDAYNKGLPTSNPGNEFRVAMT